MRRMGPASLLLGLALAAGASAGPIDDRDGEKSELETAYAPVPQAGSAEAVQQSARAASGGNPDVAAQGGNPLWTIPLSSLTATRDRPLFSATRRPASLAVQKAAPPPAPNPAPAAPEKPALRLIGTIVGPATSLAMVRDPATQAVTRLREGEEASGWRLKTVKLRSIIVEKGEQSAVLGLPERLDTLAQQAARDQPPLKDKKEPGLSLVYRQKPR